MPCEVVTADEVEVARHQPLPGRARPWPAGRAAFAPIASCRPTIVTCRPAASSASATEIASNVPVSSKTTRRALEVGPAAEAEHVPRACTRGAGRARAPGVTGVASWKPSRRGVAARGDDHLVGRDLGDDVGIDHRAEPDGHAEALDLARQPLGDRPDVGAVRSGGGDRHLPAELAGGLVQLDLVAPQRRGAGRLEPGRAAADDQHPLALRRRAGRIEAHRRLLGRGDVDDAADSAPVVISWPTQPMFEPMHGRIEVLLAPPGLVDQLGVGDQRPHHRHHVGGAARPRCARRGRAS